MVMVDGWGSATIEEIAEKVAMGQFGSSIKVETFVSEGVPVISGQHLHGIKVDDTQGFNFISHEHVRQLANANVMRGDLVLTYAGNIGQAAYIPDDSKFERYIISQRQFYMRCNRTMVIPEFVALYFRSPAGRQQLLANTSQVGVPMIARPVTYLRTIEIPLPPLPEQRSITHVLGILDDKTELNRRMNQTLEEMARVIFQDWFVDFGPVRAKLEGREPYLPPELWDWFPDRLVDSELGEVPQGWEVGALDDAIEILSGGTPKTSVLEYWDGGIPWYTAGEGYEDVPGFCKSVPLEEIQKHGHVLTPGRYVGAEPQLNDGEPFGEKMTRLTAQWREQQAEAAKLDAVIEENLKGLGYGR